MDINHFLSTFLQDPEYRNLDQPILSVYITALGNFLFDTHVFILGNMMTLLVLKYGVFATTGTNVQFVIHFTVVSDCCDRPTMSIYFLLRSNSNLLTHSVVIAETCKLLSNKILIGT